jgi:predicted metallopeptidase
MTEVLDQFNALENDAKLKVIEYGMYMVKYFRDNDINESISTLLDQKIKLEIARSERKLNLQFAREKEDSKKMQDQLIKELEIKQEQLVKIKKEYEVREREEIKKFQEQMSKELDHKQEYISKLKKECEILNEINKRGTTDIITKITDVHKDLNQLMFPGKKGRVGEVLLYNLLADEFQGCMIKDVTKKSGCCDLLLEYSGIKFIIESKMNTYETLKSHPTETIERFKKDVLNAIEEESGNIGIFVAHASHTIPGKGVLDVEECYSHKVGKYYLLYVCDTGNHPSRLRAVIELGKQLYANIDKNKKIKVIIDNIIKVNLRLSSSVKYIQDMKASINQQYKICKTLESNIEDIQNLLNGVEESANGKNTMDEKMLLKLSEMYKSLQDRGKKVTIKELKNENTKLGTTISNNIIGRGMFTLVNIRKNVMN